MASAIRDKEVEIVLEEDEICESDLSSDGSNDAEMSDNSDLVLVIISSRSLPQKLCSFTYAYNIIPEIIGGDDSVRHRT
jgi:hypothetical protein